MFIYQITNTVNNKIYIGRSKKNFSDLLKRYRRETLYAVDEFKLKGIKPRPINLVMFLYGEDKFKFEIIIDNIKTYDELIKEEEKTIISKNVRDRKFGYNIAAGGADNNTIGGRKLDISWRNNISRGGKKRYKSSIERLKVSLRVGGTSNPMYGISVKQRIINKYGPVLGEEKYLQWKINNKNAMKPPHTYENKQKMSAIAKKSWQNKETREKRISQLKKSNNPFYKKTIFNNDMFNEIEDMLQSGISIHKICILKKLSFKICFRNFKEKYGQNFKSFKSMLNKTGEKYFEENNIKLDKIELEKNIIYSNTLEELKIKYKKTYSISVSVLRNNFMYYYNTNNFRQIKKRLIQ